MSDFDPVADCYRALIGEHAADTCCKRICVMIHRMQGDPSCLTHELHFMTLARQLMNETTTFGRYIVEIDTCIKQGKYTAALLIGEKMVEHEAMLHDIAAGRPVMYASAIN